MSGTNMAKDPGADGHGACVRGHKFYRMASIADKTTSVAIRFPVFARIVELKSGSSCLLAGCTDSAALILGCRRFLWLLLLHAPYLRHYM